MGDIELAIIIVVSWAIGLAAGNIIGWHRAIKQSEKFGFLGRSGIHLLDNLDAEAHEKPRLRFHGSFWTGTYHGWSALGDTSESVIRELYKIHAQSRMWQ